jgi:two-component system, NarL family, response regulator DesR
LVVAAIRVMIVDDQPVTRDGLHAALDRANDVVVVGETDSGENAAEEAGKLTPDIVFMAARMPGMSWIDATKAIREASPTTEVILFRVDEPLASISEAIQAGVSGYLENNLSADELVNAVRLVLGEAVRSTHPDPPPHPPAASAALAVPIQQAEDVPTHVGKPSRRQSGSRSRVV